MPTIKQRLAVEAMMENGGVASRAMLKAGYSPAMAKNPHKLTKTQGFKDLMDECGLTDDLIVTSLADDIKAKPKHRVHELRLAADIKGMTKRDKDDDSTVPIQIIMFNNGHHNTPQFSTNTETVSTEDSSEPITFQVFEDPSQGR